MFGITMRADVTRSRGGKMVDVSAGTELGRISRGSGPPDDDDDDDVGRTAVWVLLTDDVRTKHLQPGLALDDIARRRCHGSHQQRRQEP